MTLSEFKAWFEGYTDGMDEKAPSEKQWKKIKAKVSEITGTPTTYPVFLTHYYRPYLDHGVWSATGTADPLRAYLGTTGQGIGVSQSYNANFPKPDNSVTEPFDAHSAMFALGKSDALAN